MKKTLFLLLVTTLILSGCANNPVAPSQTQVVLQGYLYANQPVKDISLATSMAIGGTDSVDTPITSATVALLRNGTRYPLASNPTEPGNYFYPGNDLSVTIGDSFSIEVDVNGQHISAQTVVPSKPEQLGLSATTLRFQTDSVQSRFGTRIVVNGLDTADVTWSNPTADYFYVVIESVDQNRQLMRPDSTFTRRFVSQPTNQTSYRLNNNAILYTGQHVLRLYHVNKEYADLYRSRIQDSRTLNEPLTNVQNGLGIFSAFASDSLYFNVVFN